MAAQDEHFLVDYMDRMQRLLAKDAGLFDTIIRTRQLWLATRERGGTVIFVGNGGSAGICSHLAIDLSKNAKVPATCFNDASLITCLANDYGYDQWMAHALRLNARAGDCLVAISSSGRSANVLNAVAKARELQLSIVTLSGMTADNPLRESGDINFWAPSRSYNVVETAHQFWLMAVIDLIIGKAEYPAS
jgi:D-sedoheptulose 7-phosphate isomerase